MADDPNVITEDDKRFLTRHLIAQVIIGLSGRDGADIVDASPSRNIFAGVLQPPRQAQIKATTEGSSGGEAPPGTALGLDFRAIPASPQVPIRLGISAGWSYYYAIFPSYMQARASNGTLIQVQQAQTLPTAVAENAGPVSADLEMRDEPLPESNNDVDEEVEVDDSQDAVSGRVILPRVFRRLDVRPEPAVVTVPIDLQQTVQPGSEQFEQAIQRARTQIDADPGVWRHLGATSEQRERGLGDASVLASEEAYRRALSRVKGEKAAAPEWAVSLQVESGPDPAAPGTLRIRVLLANTTPERNDSDPGLEERALLDASLSVEIEGGVVVPFDFLLAPKDYRSKPQMPAKGINCSAMWESARPNFLKTDTLPIFEQPYYRTRESMEIPFDGLVGEDALPRLSQIADEMDTYLGQWDRFLGQEAPKSLSKLEIEACKKDRDEFSKEIAGYRLGIETLRRDSRLADAFRLMNQAFARRAKARSSRIRAWRMFQIGFIVSQLPSLAVRELNPGSDDYSNSVKTALEEVGVLWFPTGGGKTEAYLGLISIALLYDRLRGKIRGVCAWLRFPLRMLSLQQLERLAQVIAALNELREEETRLRVGDPFAIGYYVGGGVTPNSLSDQDMRRFETNKDLREEVRLLRKCPFCGSGVNIETLRASWRLAHVCSNEQCFSNTATSLGAYKGSLPVSIVDTEIYRYLPSVLLGTVDKLAVAGFNRYFAQIMRGSNEQCAAHGYTSYGECIERWGAGCKAGKKDIRKLQPVRDPGPSLIIQDELHLLRAELGVFNGHYEGLVRYLGAKAHLPPKILAATATIEAYDVHAFHIYLSRARRYPQPSWEQGESFYATSKPERIRRFYVGVLNHTRANEDPALRILGLYWKEIRRLTGNPRQAAEAMRRPDALDEAVLDALRLYDLSLGYVGRRATGGSLVDKMSQVDRLLARDGLDPVRSKLLTGDQRSEEVGATLERIERERADTGEPRLDVLVATNLISHGVDLERINMMVMCGMPSHYAEYLQATSRCARSYPGAVFACYNGRDPREISLFEFFGPMHTHIDRLIEAVAVNRFASFAPDKTIPGLLVGLLLSEITPRLFGSKISRPLDHVPTLQTALGLRPTTTSGTQANCVSIAEIQTAIEEIIGVDIVRPPAMDAQVQNVKKRVAEVLADNIAAIGRSLETRITEVVTPITSFRDVDEGIDFGSIDSASFVTRLRAR